MLTIAIDLDETLVCVTQKPLHSAPGAVCDHGHIYLRPHALELLTSLATTTSVGIWSSASQPYVDRVLSASGLGTINLSFVWSANECSFVDYGTGQYYARKDTNRLREIFKTDAVLLVDNSPEKIAGHGNDGIVAAPFHGDDDDTELLTVHRFIEHLQKAQTNQTFSKFKWRHLA